MKIINPYKMFQGAFIPNSIMECRELSQSAKLMWARLAQYAGRDGRCFPKIASLAAEIGLSERQAKRVIKELAENKFLAIKKPTGKDRLMHLGSEYFFLDHPVFSQKNQRRSGGDKNVTSGSDENGTSLEVTKMSPPIEENHIRESYTTSDPEKISGGGVVKKKKHGSPEDHALALKMYQAVLVVNQTIKEPNYDNWANTIRLMREQDGRTHAGIWRVFSWANRDVFWGSNILSPDAVRRHYSKLAPKAGLVRSQVRGVSADVTGSPGAGMVCGQCEFAGLGKGLCAGWDTDPDHPACELFRRAAVEVVK